MILFVDDEPFYVDSYVDDLKDAGFDVLSQKRIAAAMKAFEEQQAQVDLIIIDIIMPSDGVVDDTQGDLRTGFAFFDWVRHRSPNLPVIVLTNASASDVDQKFVAQPRCRLVRKDQCLPFELVQHVQELLGIVPNDR